MKIRNKLLLAFVVPVGLLIVQIALVNVFVRELQQAATFIATTQETIEESFTAVDLVAELRQETRRLPSSFVSDRSTGDEGLAEFRQVFGDLKQHFDSIRQSETFQGSVQVDPTRLDTAFEELGDTLDQAEDALANDAIDMDMLLAHAVFLDSSLVELAAALNALSRDLRVQLQLAVDREREIHNRPVIAGVAIGGLSVLMLLIFTWLVVDRSFIARTTRLSDALLAIARGDLNTTLPEPRGNDEIDDMARTVETFRSTTLERDRLLEEAEKSAERLEREVAERTAELASANDYKTRFLAMASHDLRQPLHALNLFIAQLRDQPGPERREELERRINESATAINELFDALLDMSKLEAGVLVPDVNPLQIALILDRIDATFATMAADKGLRFRVVGSGAWVSSDAILLERILLNLVSNAIRATPEGQGVLVGCRRRGGILRIDVCDTGPGIPEDVQSELFKEFYRLAPSSSNKSDSLGLGLSIVDGLVQLLGHKIELSSILGRGTRFSVSLPMVPAMESMQTKTTPTIKIEPLAGRRILVIDDDALVRDSMSGILDGWGCEVDLSDSVDSAIDAASNAVPDLVISDFRLESGRSGLEAIEAVQKIAGHAVPAFLITAETSPERLRKATEGGIPILHKPVTPIALRAISSQLLAGG